MLHDITHAQGPLFENEILFDTSFGYMFDYLCRNKACLLKNGHATIENLLKLGEIMADPGTPADLQNNSFDSNTPAIHTYLGQFIDHDITARTDRTAGISEIEGVDGAPGRTFANDPNLVVQKLKNGRRPQLDLDSVFGDGPSFNSHYETEADILYNNTNMKLFLGSSTHLDLRRRPNGIALIADARNDENVMISQLHAAFIKFYNKMVDEFSALPKAESYACARQMVRWTYQYIVLNEYLMKVCDENVVKETMINGPYYFPSTGESFMPLEFSVAAFRFGHSMIRPGYIIKNQTTPIPINELIAVSGQKNNLLNNSKILKSTLEVKWSNFDQFAGLPAPQMARKIDAKIALGLFDLPFDEVIPNTMMARLTQRNLLRGFILSIPVGQAVAKAMRIRPLAPNDLKKGLSNSQKQILTDSRFDTHTPLWYYILKESEIHHDGNRLGYVGSKLVAETLIGFVKKDPNSYLNNQNHPAVTTGGIQVNQNTTIATMADLLTFADVRI